jgi:hypothetical protein
MTIERDNCVVCDHPVEAPTCTGCGKIDDLHFHSRRLVVPCLNLVEGGLDPASFQKIVEEIRGILQDAESEQAEYKEAP